MERMDGWEVEREMDGWMSVTANGIHKTSYFACYDFFFFFSDSSSPVNSSSSHHQSNKAILIN